MINHPTQLSNYKGSVDDYAKDIVGMRFDKTAEHLHSLAYYLYEEYEHDKKLGHPKNARKLYWASKYVGKAAEQMDGSWEICEPYMKPKLHFNPKYLIPFALGIAGVYFGSYIDSENVQMVTRSISAASSFASVWGIFWPKG